MHPTQHDKPFLAWSWICPLHFPIFSYHMYFPMSIKVAWFTRRHCTMCAVCCITFALTLSQHEAIIQVDLDSILTFRINLFILSGLKKSAEISNIFCKSIIQLILMWHKGLASHCEPISHMSVQCPLPQIQESNLVLCYLIPSHIHVHVHICSPCISFSAPQFHVA